MFGVSFFHPKRAAGARIHSVYLYTNIQLKIKVFARRAYCVGEVNQIMCVCVCPFVRSSVRSSVAKRLVFRALDGVCRTSPRPLYSVGDCSMIQLNDSESLVSVQQVFSDHRARAPL